MFSQPFGYDCVYINSSSSPGAESSGVFCVIKAFDIISTHSLDKWMQFIWIYTIGIKNTNEAKQHNILV